LRTSFFLVLTVKGRTVHYTNNIPPKNSSLSCVVIAKKLLYFTIADRLFLMANLKTSMQNHEYEIYSIVCGKSLDALAM
jgi:hypothetical protein